MTAGAAAGKAAVRARVGAWRRRLAPLEIEAWSQAICAHLLDWGPLARAHSVLGFAALRREPQIAELLARLADRGQRIWLPQVSGNAIEIVAPAGGQSLPPEALDAVLVPGLAFDGNGCRLGRGGGHYDRLLARVRAGCLRIGVCFGGQVVDAVPVDPWDQAVDVVVTEGGVLEGAGGHGPAARR